jgi:hypothetical protein
VEYDVPRSLDVADRLGIPFFTTVQALLAVAGVLLAVLLHKSGLLWAIDPGLGATAEVLVVALALLLPRQSPRTGWTVGRTVAARVGRWLRPRRTIWRP